MRKENNVVRYTWRILLRLGMYTWGERRWSFSTAIEACVIEEI